MSSPKHVADVLPPGSLSYANANYSLYVDLLRDGGYAVVVHDDDKAVERLLDCLGGGDVVRHVRGPKPSLCQLDQRGSGRQPFGTMAAAETIDWPMF